MINNKKVMIKNNKQSVKGFWKDLPKGFSCLAPMADVTDVAFSSNVRKVWAT